MTHLPKVYRLADAKFAPGLREFLQYRDFGVLNKTKGSLNVKQIDVKDIPDDYKGTGHHRHLLDFQMIYILQGWVEFEFPGSVVKLMSGDALILPPGIEHAQIGYSNDMKLLEITAPGEFETLK